MSRHNTFGMSLNDLIQYFIQYTYEQFINRGSIGLRDSVEEAIRETILWNRVQK